jgi:hypothetical protein
VADGDNGVEGSAELTAFQMEVARLFFALPESTGFLLAGRSEEPVRSDRRQLLNDRRLSDPVPDVLLDCVEGRYG